MKILFGKLDETNKRLDDLQGERPRDLDVCHEQVDPLQDSEVIIVEEDEGTKLETVPPVQVLAEFKPEHEPLLGIVSGREAVEACLGLPEMLRRILEYVSSQELIKLSLVNKSWNFEARSVLRDRGCLRARIHDSTACQGLVDFAVDLQQMRVVPFTGISVLMTHDEHEFDICESLSSESLHPSYQVILDRLPWKCLSVKFRRSLSLLQDCPAFLLVKRILEDYCWVLEELSFDYDYCNPIEFFQGIFQYERFSFLKILKFTGPGVYPRTGSPYTPAFVKTILSAAPNLEQLCIDGPIEFKENVMEGSSAVLVSTSLLCPLTAKFSESLIDVLRAESINVFLSRCGLDFDVALLNRFLPMFITASHTTLKSLKMDLHFAVPLMCYGIVLENVTELLIRVTKSDPIRTEPDILALVKSFDFTRVFPKLDKVKILDVFNEAVGRDAMNAFVERGNAAARKALPDRAINITHLELEYIRDSPPPLILWSQMFAHVKTLSVKTYYLHLFPFTLLWEHFGGLTELHVHFLAITAPTTINLDSVFCGIFPEEVAELRAKDDEYLRAVNIVPVMPSIACTKDLRLFTLRYHFCPSTTKDSTRMFSKVTGLIGFSRCPDLSVTLKTRCDAQNSLDHMKPYVTAVVEDSD